MSDKKEFYANGVPAGDSTPTNKQAATRAYCAKHSRAMLDIGGEKKCPACEAERKRAEKP
jgi:hypothetical protein